MISVCIAHRNDPYIYFTVNALLKGIDPSTFEIIIYDDASEYPLQVNNLLYPNVRVLVGSSNKGVGYAFDQCVKNATYENIVLMGSDVLTKDPSWLDTVTKYVSEYPYGIGCSTCISGDTLHLDPLNPADDTKRYGSRLLPLVSSEDLSSDSPLFEDTSMRIVDMFQGKWYKKIPDKEVNEVPSLMGAYYFTNKSWYNYIGGWDLLHRYWGGLEAWISLKTWLCGGKIHNVRDLETLHIFHKFAGERSPHGRMDYYWYNKMCIAHTMLPSDLAKRLINTVYSLRVKDELHTYPFNLGKSLIKEYWEKVSAVKRRNEEMFIHDFYWFCEKFGIDINF